MLKNNVASSHLPFPPQGIEKVGMGSIERLWSEGGCGDLTHVYLWGLDAADRRFKDVKRLAQALSSGTAQRISADQLMLLLYLTRPSSHLLPARISLADLDRLIAAGNSAPECLAHLNTLEARGFSCFDAGELAGALVRTATDARVECERVLSILGSPSCDLLSTGVSVDQRVVERVVCEAMAARSDVLPSEVLGLLMDDGRRFESLNALAQVRGSCGAEESRVCQRFGVNFCSFVTCFFLKNLTPPRPSAETRSSSRPTSSSTRSRRTKRQLLH